VLLGCLLDYSGVQNFVPLCVLTLLVPCSDVRYDFDIKRYSVRLCP
jgi:hypothetical protein